MHSSLAVFGLHILKYIVWFKGETWIVHVVFINIGKNPNYEFVMLGASELPLYLQRRV